MLIDEILSGLSAAGASAYVLKSRLLTDLIPAIREALLGNIFVSQPLKFASLGGSSNKALVS